MGLKLHGIPSLMMAYSKTFPFSGHYTKVQKTVVAIRDAIFAKMVYKFLFELKDIPFEKRKSFVDKIEADEKYKKNVGEKLIVILDRLDDLDKPSLIGKLFKYSIDEKITFEDFLRISNIIQKSHLPDLLILKISGNVDYLNDSKKEHLITLGLIKMYLEENHREKKLKQLGGLDVQKLGTIQKITFELNDLGTKIRQFLLECA